MKPSRKLGIRWPARTGWLLLVGVAGCGGRELYPVGGKVAYKDGADVSVLAGGMVTFVPTDPEIKVSAQGYIKPDGSFEMSTFREGDGVVPGKYTVLVAAPRFNVKGGRFKTPPQVLDERFKDL